MARQPIKKITLYRWRFLLGYGLLALSLIGILSFATLYVPGGINLAEQNSALKSASLRLDQPSSLLVTDLPYHALQKISITIFGLSNPSIKLPSLLLSSFAGISFIFLLRRWLKPSVSVITASIADVSPPFIFLAQLGSPSIMVIFWPIIILLLASISLRRDAGKCKLLTVPLLGVASGLSLYTPMSFFLLLALAIGGMLHPQIRYAVRKYINKPLMASAVVMAIIAILPLAYMIYRTQVLIIGLGISSGNLSFDIIHNFKILALQLFDITGRSTPFTGAATPFFTLPALLLSAAGVFQLFKERHGAQNYLLTAWISLLLPITLLNPHQPELLFVPFMLLTGVGVAFTLDYWYKLFPLNPYARAFALIPLIILIGGIILTDTLRYFYTYHYSAPLATQSTPDLRLIDEQIKNAQDQSRQPIVIVSPAEHPFYQLYNDVKHMSFKFTQDIKTTDASNEIIATKDSRQTQSKYTPSSVIADDTAGDESDRLYIYKK